MLEAGMRTKLGLTPGTRVVYSLLTVIDRPEGGQAPTDGAT